jgi:hypothetical protein
VLEFDSESGDGKVIFDDGSVRPFGAEAFLASGLRLLRPGQRVRLTSDAAGDIAAVTIATLPDA